MKALFAAIVLLFAASQANAESVCDQSYKNKHSRENVVCSFMESMGYLTDSTVWNICPLGCGQRQIMVIMSRLQTAGFAVQPSASSGCGTLAISQSLASLGRVTLPQAVSYIADASKQGVKTDCR